MSRRQLLRGGAVIAVATAAGVEAKEKSLVERLGFDKDTRALMIHADDVGMCRSVNFATTKALTEGVAASAAVMVPCPWFPEIAAWSREHPEADLGLHLTLTSEWRYYRWRPVAPITQVKGLLDEEGFMWRDVEGVVKHASPEEVEIEIRAQIERARQFGMKPTHVDSHMGTLFADKRFFDAYIRVAKDVKIVPMIPGPTPDILLQAAGLGLNYTQLTRDLAAKGYVVLDKLTTSLTKKTYEERKAELMQFIRDLKPGVTELIVHLSGDEDEIQHISGSWPTRSIEGRMMLDPEIKAFVAEQKVRPIGYRPLNALFAKS
jgi:chitin disaccharide deacetylase